jgi:hypothetical protein
VSGGAWLKCDHCNKELRVEADQTMQLAVRFKPSLFPLSVGQLHPEEHRHRCRACGWVNVFVPSASVAAERQCTARRSLLTPSWRDVTLKS